MKPVDRPEKITIEYKGILKFIDIAAGADHSLALSGTFNIQSKHYQFDVDPNQTTVLTCYL